MDKLQKLMTKIQQDTGLSFSLFLQGNLIFGEDGGEKYPLKLKETYGFLSFISPPTKEVLSLLKLVLEKEINEYMEESSLIQAMESFILGKTQEMVILEDLKKTLPQGKLFLIESKQLEENKTLLQEAFENEVHYLWTLEGRLLLFLHDTKEEEISQSIYASILENTMEEPYVAFSRAQVLFADLPLAYGNLKRVLQTGKTYFIDHHIYDDQALLYEKFLFTLPKEVKENLIFPYKTRLDNLDQEDKAMIYYYVKNHMALQKTAKDLHLHRNTLTYRLGKLEKDFGLDLKNMTHVIFLYMMIVFLNEL